MPKPYSHILRRIKPMASDYELRSLDPSALNPAPDVHIAERGYDYTLCSQLRRLKVLRPRGYQAFCTQCSQIFAAEFLYYPDEDD